MALPVGYLKGVERAPNRCTHAGWTDERVERLKELWAKGWSATQIARDLRGVTRNSVIGKVTRLGLPKRSAAANRVASKINNRALASGAAPQPEATAKPAVARKPPEPVEIPRTADEIAKAPRPWETRAFRECAFPIEQPDGAIWSCCNDNKGRVNWPYCDEHLQLLARKPSKSSWTPEQRAKAAARARETARLRQALRSAA